jgi:hypothetical protein
MKINLKSSVIFLIIGIILVMVGAMLKIVHLPFAEVILAVGMIVELAAIVAIIVLVLTKKVKSV